MRFEVSRVMDAIEQRLTTDPTLAQAVVDLGAVTRFVDLDGGRPVNLLRVGMAVDALSRFLVDAGAMLYAVAARDLLSESALTSKERMVLGRWTGDGLIEVADRLADRAVEVADLTGLPLIAVQPYDASAKRFPWLTETPERVLRLTPRHGFAVLTPCGAVEVTPEVARAVVIGKAALPTVEEPVALAEADGPDKPPAAEEPAEPDETEEPAAPVVPPESAAPPAAEEAAETEEPAAPAAAEEPAAPAAAEEPDKPAETEGQSAPAAAEEPANSEGPPAPADTDEPAEPDEPAEDEERTPEAGGTGTAALPSGVEVFITRGAQRLSHTLIARRRFTRAAPSEAGTALLARQWRCPEPDCPMFGEFRLGGQPVPTLRQGKPTCPRHGDQVRDIGARPAAYAISVVVDDLARRRFVVGVERAVLVGRAPENPEDISLGDWLHEAAADWVDPVHLRLEVREGRLVVTDDSDNGTVVWRRSGPDERAKPRRLHHASFDLGEWDSVELYTGYELVRGDRRLTTTVGSADPLSVLVDAPTVAMPLLSRK